MSCILITDTGCFEGSLTWADAFLTNHDSDLDTSVISSTMCCDHWEEAYLDWKIATITAQTDMLAAHGKTLIPVISPGREGENNDIFNWTPSAKYQSGWIDYVQANFSSALIGSFGLVSCCPKKWVDGVPYRAVLQSPQELAIDPAVAEIKKMIELFPWVFSGNPVLCVSEVPFEREAWLCRDDLTQATLRNLVIEYGIRLIFHRGAWAVHNNRTEHLEYMEKCAGKTWSPLHAHDYPDKQTGPFTYFKDYLSGLDAWSGLGHGCVSLSQLQDAGYNGCLMYAEQSGKLAVDDAKESLLFQKASS